ncbi:MAG TPA: GntR family transcriptional regulator [Burkholderiales bacterium]|jgi:DNA-binding GntR family transcriptional regulator|nr:GntR family transcriptional regulator [Burkholderiales bacterium]
MSVSSLNTFVSSVAARILEVARRDDYAAGHHLTEQGLAEALGVSRSPIRKALQYLEALGVVESQPNRGFFLAKPAAKLQKLAAQLPAPHAEAAEEDYLRIADDRLSGLLAEEVSEAELMERYGLPRGQVQRILNRMAKEGLVERKPGRGWLFLPMMTTADAHDQSYRFRMIIEPAALLEPDYRADPVALARCRREQEEMLERGIAKWSPAELFRIGAQFHETIIGFSGNRFLLEALRGQNRLRRVLEYRGNLDRQRLIRQCEEHLQLIALLQAGDFAQASAFLRDHLDVVRDIKITKEMARERAPAAYIHF